MDQVLSWIVSQLHLDGVTLLMLLMMLSMVCQVIGKLIPDDATGWKGYVRQGAKIVGLYVSNRIQPGVSVTTVAKASVSQVPEVVDDLIEQRLAKL